MELGPYLRREQWGFFRRNRRAWSEHLQKTHALGQDFFRACPVHRPVLILGAGGGLEIPWKYAPPNTIGWDGDPWSRTWTFLRHFRWAPWIFGDFTGGFGELDRLVMRCTRRSYSQRGRKPDVARLRLAGLLDYLEPDPVPLKSWIETHRPGGIWASNCFGQIHSVAQGMVEEAFKPVSPWSEAGEEDPLHQALGRWCGRCLRVLFPLLIESGVELLLIHDRVILHEDPEVELGPFQWEWMAQIQSREELEASDPLCGVDPFQEFIRGSHEDRLQDFTRWLWSVGLDQLHLMEAIRLRSLSSGVCLGGSPDCV